MELRMSTIPELEDQLAKKRARLKALREIGIEYIGPTMATNYPKNFFGTNEVVDITDRVRATEF